MLSLPTARCWRARGALPVQARAGTGAQGADATSLFGISLWKATPCGADGRLKVVLTVFSPPRERRGEQRSSPWAWHSLLTDDRFSIKMTDDTRTDTYRVRST